MRRSCISVLTISLLGVFLFACDAGVESGIEMGEDESSTGTFNVVDNSTPENSRGTNTDSTSTSDDGVTDPGDDTVFVDRHAEIPQGEIGAPCTLDADCGDTDQTSCIPATMPDGTSGFPEGYCSEVCTEGTCPDGSACYSLTEDLMMCLDQCKADSDCRSGYICNVEICWPDCETLGCADGQVCGADGHCHAEADLESGCTSGSCPLGQYCDSATGQCLTQPDNTNGGDNANDGNDQGDASPPSTDESTNALPGSVGSPCEADTDCPGSENAYCLPAPDFPGGYCTVWNCETAGCPTGSECFMVGEGNTICLMNCVQDADCGGSYVCEEPGACIPNCVVGGCPEGMTCSGVGHCIEGGGTSNTPDCTPGSCPEGQSCVNGDCVYDGSQSSGDGQVGDACGSAAECPGGGNAACLPDPQFPEGYCTIAECGTVGCPAESTCWTFTDDNTYCLEDCMGDSDCRPGYICDEYNSCWLGCESTGCPSGETCAADGHCSAATPCTSDSDCEDGFLCSETSQCIPDLGWTPEGPAPSCPASGLPSKTCTQSLTTCGELIQFDPSTTVDYDDYPINGETTSNQYRSWSRRDMTMLIKWASAYVSCMGAGWSGNGPPLGLGDMSEVDGNIPGASIGQPGHPESTHTDGYDMDIGYYQVNTPNNQLRPICEHTTGGQEQYHCTATPHLLDVWRTSLFLGALLTSERTRVIGVDGKVGPLVAQTMPYLCSGGWLPAAACNNLNALAYETTDGGAGWFHFHHHHLHVSLWGIAGSTTGLMMGTKCLTPNCKDDEASFETLINQHLPGHAFVMNPRAEGARFRVKTLQYFVE